MCHCRQIGHWSGYRHTHRHGQTFAGGIETGIAADRFGTCSRGYGKQGLRQTKGGDRAAYVMPNWLSRLASISLSNYQAQLIQS